MLPADSGAGVRLRKSDADSSKSSILLKVVAVEEHILLLPYFSVLRSHLWIRWLLRLRPHQITQFRSHLNYRMTKVRLILMVQEAE